LPIFDKWLSGCERVLDPFAGIGTYARDGLIYSELEYGWAAQCPAPSIVADALHLPFPRACMDAVVTSPVYGNRMSDHHDARDGTERITYKHKLGHDLHSQNAGSMQWGPRYCLFHMRAWSEVYRVLKSGGKFVLNVADHVRSWQRERVSQWHLKTCLDLGFHFEDCVKVPTPGMRYGQNSGARVPFQYVFLFEKG
jgi:SAM-dependent methyltransferase